MLILGPCVYIILTHKDKEFYLETFSAELLNPAKLPLFEGAPT